MQARPAVQVGAPPSHNPASLVQHRRDFLAYVVIEPVRRLPEVGSRAPPAQNRATALVLAHRLVHRFVSGGEGAELEIELLELLGAGLRPAFPLRLFAGIAALVMVVDGDFHEAAHGRVVVGSEV